MSDEKVLTKVKAMKAGQKEIRSNSPFVNFGQDIPQNGIMVKQESPPYVSVFITDEDIERARKAKGEWIEADGWDAEPKGDDDD